MILLQIANHADTLDFLNKVQEFYEHSWDKLLWFITTIAALATFILGYIVPAIQKRQFVKQQKENEEEHKQEILKVTNLLRAEFTLFKNELEEQVKSKVDKIYKDFENEKMQNQYNIALTNTLAYRSQRDYDLALGFAAVAIGSAISLNSQDELSTAITSIINMQGLSKKDLTDSFPLLENFLFFIFERINDCNGNEDLIKEVNRLKSHIMPLYEQADK